MKVLIAYTSWFSSNSVIARLLATKLARGGLAVRCVPAWRVAPNALDDYDLLILGTNIQTGRASKRLRSLCSTIPRKRLDRLEIALFGTQPAGGQLRRRPSALGELEACLAERGCELALPPLVVAFTLSKGLLFWLGIGPAARAQLDAKVSAFAADLWEACVPEPMI